MNKIYDSYRIQVIINFGLKCVAKSKIAAKTRKNVKSNNYFVNAKFVTS